MHAQLVADESDPLDMLQDKPLVRGLDNVVREYAKLPNTP